VLATLFATDMLAEGLNVVELKELMGHEDIKTTIRTRYQRAAAVVNRRNHSKSLHLLKATGRNRFRKTPAMVQ
jgi:site-specific recombinase XerD